MEISSSVTFTFGSTNLRISTCSGICFFRSSSVIELCCNALFKASSPPNWVFKSSISAWMSASVTVMLAFLASWSTRVVVIRFCRVASPPASTSLSYSCALVMSVPFTEATATLLSSFWKGCTMRTTISAAARTIEAIIQPRPPLEPGVEGGVPSPTLFITGTLAALPGASFFSKLSAACCAFTGSASGADEVSSSAPSLISEVLFSSGVPLLSRCSFSLKSFLSIIINDSLQYRCCLSFYNFTRNQDSKP
ncbi:hypothetical protein D3C76_788660 [compost metagenome]